MSHDAPPAAPALSGASPVERSTPSRAPQDVPIIHRIRELIP